MKAKPMLCEKEHPQNKSGYIYQKKIRGGRICVDNGFFRTRHSSSPVNFKYPEIYKELGEFCPEWKTSGIDGEMCVLGEDGLPNQSLLQSRSGLTDRFKIHLRSKTLPVLYFVFDMTYYDGQNIKDVRLDERAVNKDSFLRDNCKETEHIRFLKWYEDGEQIFREYTEIGGEGVVAKKLDSPYIDGYRGKKWLKWKRVKEDVDCTVIGVTNKDALVIMHEREYKGKVYPINGHDMYYPSIVAKELYRLRTDEPPIDVPAEVLNEIKFWIQPKIIAVVDFHDYINPVFKRFRPEDQ